MTHEQMMAYLYGELSSEEQAEFERWLEQHPTAKAELNELKSTRSLLGLLEDIRPSATTVELKPRPLISKKWMQWMSIAAGLALALMVARPQLEVTGRGAMVTFGSYEKQAPSTPKPANDDDAIQQLVAQSNFKIYKQLDSIQKQLGDKIAWKEQTLMTALENELNSHKYQQQQYLTRTVNNQYQERIPRIVSNVQSMQLEQRQEVKQMLNRLWQEWQKQRERDMEAIERAILELQLQVQEDEQIPFEEID